MSPRAAQHPSRLDAPALTLLLETQHGVVCRRQVFQLGWDDSDINRRLGHRVWVRVHPGVYVDHTGVLTWHQRAWAAVLARWPTALGGESALHAHGFGSSARATGINAGRAGTVDPPLHLVAQHRTVDPLAGVRIERVSGFAELVHTQRSPPVVRLEQALLKVAGSLSPDAAVAVLSDACQHRRTTPARLVVALGAMPRLRQRAFLLDVLDDVASGAYSVLERRYLRQVERAHGLPKGQRQVLASTGARQAFRDVEYAEPFISQQVVVELDGRLGHEEADDRWADLDRDIAAAVSGRLTLRVSWRQVLQPCRLAPAVATILQTRGWVGRPLRCSPGCSVDDSAGSSG